ncbi:hypothetical protein M0Q50_06535 [bacterium]|jgi:hypothetical protein|nr:hypothetical protein [bacterium]
MKQKEERDELKKMLEKSPQDINKNVPGEQEDIPGLQIDPVTDVNFIELKEKCENDARIMLTNAIAFILPTDMIESNEYLKNKLEVDTMSLAGMVYQLRTNEVMQKALIDQVNLGMVNARMFEVFSNMSKTIGELNKQLIQTVEAIKETYKTFKNDVKEQRTEALGPTQGTNGLITTGDGGLVTRGTREMINNSKDRKRAELILENSKVIPNIHIEDIRIENNTD